MYFSSTTSAVLRHVTYFFLLLSGILLNTYSMKQSDLHYCEAMKIRSKPSQSTQRILACGSYFHTKFDQACDVIFIASK